jgi:hypothetical protein
MERERERGEKEERGKRTRTSKRTRTRMGKTKGKREEKPPFRAPEGLTGGEKAQHDANKGCLHPASP